LSALPPEFLGAELWLGVGVVFLSGVMRGFSGFGGAMLVVPVFSILYSPVEAVAIAMLLSFLANLQLVPGARVHMEWRQVLPISVMGLVTIPLGSLLLLTLDPEVMRRAISAVVLAFVLLLGSGWRSRRRPGIAGALGAGALGGFINGAAGVGGPPVILYLLAGPGSAKTNRANLIGIYAFLTGGTVISLAANGVITAEILWRLLLFAPAFVAAVWVGMRMFGYASEAFYRRFALTVLAVAALLGLFYPGR
jgi:uncharacterized membrane protein YfcA